MDRIVGEAMAKRPGGSELFVVSDHGFSSFRRSVNYNTWLVKNGYMTLKGQGTRKSLEDLFDEGEFLDNVDWSQTKAYALGLGQLYINLAGREAQGIVKPEEYDQVVAEIKAGLEGYVDEQTGENPVAYVFTRKEAYGDSDPLLMPDMVPSNNDGYRVGWQDSLGGFGQDVVEDNDRVWSGDHCSVYPPLVEGIFYSTLKVDRQPYMADFMPTVLGIYGVELPAKLDGESLLTGDRAAGGR
jgi:predicted AlkP superfamily phosphohydrolase/phosphomutase